MEVMGIMVHNIYCDESCHLQAQGGPMVLGALRIDASKRYAYRDAVRAIKAKYGIPLGSEMKWTRISPSKADAYLELVKWFFETNGLSFRALVAPNKGLSLEKFAITYDDWYYRMYFRLLSPMLPSEGRTNIYVDVKDTRGTAKVRRLREVLCNSELDFDHRLIKKVQEIRSHEFELMSVVDVLTGALSHMHRGFVKSAAKTRIIEEIKRLSGFSLERTTLLSELKFNLFCWRPQDV